MKPYRYKLSPRPPRKENLNRLGVTSEGEYLTGIVQGQEASDLEERFARALDSVGKDYQFQVEVTGPATIPGQENKIDFVVDNEWPVEVDGGFVHKSAEAKGRDQMRDAILNDFIKKFGWKPIQRITETDLDGQETADRTAREMFF